MWGSTSDRGLYHWGRSVSESLGPMSIKSNLPTEGAPGDGHVYIEPWPRWLHEDRAVYSSPKVLRLQSASESFSSVFANFCVL